MTTISRRGEKSWDRIILFPSATSNGCCRRTAAPGRRRGQLHVCCAARLSVRPCRYSDRQHTDHKASTRERAWMRGGGVPSSKTEELSAPHRTTWPRHRNDRALMLRPRAPAALKRSPARASQDTPRRCERMTSRPQSRKPQDRSQPPDPSVSGQMACKYIVLW
jgi:hypothetical protein